MRLHQLLGELVASNEQEFRDGRARLVPITRAGVRYQREPRGREEWQSARDLQRTRKGDCEDLAAYEVARLRVAGIRATIDLEANSIGWHVTCRLPDGRVWDPSLACGMGQERDDDFPIERE